MNHNNNIAMEDLMGEAMNIEKQKNALENENYRLKGTNERRLEEITKLRMENNCLKKESSERSNKLVEMQKILQEKELEIVALKSTVSTTPTEEKDTEWKMKYETELEEKRELEEKLKTALLVPFDDSLRTSNDMEPFINLLNEKEEENNTLREEVRKIKEAKSGVEVERAKLLMAQKKLEKDNEQLRLKLQLISPSNKDARSSPHSSFENEQLRSKIEMLSKENALLSAKITRLTIDAEKLIEEKKQTRRTASVVLGDFSKLKNEFVDLKSNFSQFQKIDDAPAFEKRLAKITAKLKLNAGGDSNNNLQKKLREEMQKSAGFAEAQKCQENLYKAEVEKNAKLVAEKDKLKETLRRHVDHENAPKKSTPSSSNEKGGGSDVDLKRENKELKSKLVKLETEYKTTVEQLREQVRKALSGFES